MRCGARQIEIRALLGRVALRYLGRGELTCQSVSFGTLCTMARAWIVLFALLAISGLCLGEEINQTKLEDNEQAQAEGREEEEPVVSHVVEAADEVELQRWVKGKEYTCTPPPTRSARALVSVDDHPSNVNSFCPQHIFPWVS